MTKIGVLFVCVFCVCKVMAVQFIDGTFSSYVEGYNLSNVARVTIPEEYEGYTITLAFFGGAWVDDDAPGVFYLYNPNNQAMSSQVLRAGDHQIEGTVAFYTKTKAIPGNYYISYREWCRFMRIQSFYAIVWDAPGDDLERIQEDLNQQITDLRDELTGTLDYRLGQMQDEIDALRKQLNEAIQKNEEDHAALIRRIEDHEREIKTLITEFQFNLARLERQQADFLAQLTVLKIQHEKDVEMIYLKIDNLNNQYSLEVSRIQLDISRIERELSSLNQTDRDLYDKISDLREKQADYYARLEVIKVTHEKDKEALEKEIAALQKEHDEDVRLINEELQLLQQEMDNLKKQHDRDIAAIQNEIKNILDKMDSEVRKLYLELENQKQACAEYQEKILKSIDDLQMQITLLDKAVTDRLKNLENRIRYAVYSDEKLADLVKEYTQLIQDKETEIANLDLEIRELEEFGRDTTAKQEQRSKNLDELLALRNELTDIEFAIKIRYDDSEFTVHEAEIERLKAELAALRQSSDLRIQQLEEKLMDTENRLLALLNEIQESAAAENASLRKDLEDFKALVQIFIETLREEQISGDDTLRKLISEMDESHRALLSQLDTDFADRLERLKFEQDVQFENLRSTINNIAYQQRFSNGNSSGSYGLPTVRDEDIPSDSRDLRVSPNESLNLWIN